MDPYSSNEVSEDVYILFVSHCTAEMTVCKSIIRVSSTSMRVHIQHKN